MEIEQLNSFVQIVRLGSFRRASEALHLTQPALSRRIRLLESELGLPLLKRHGRGAVPTSAGMALVKHAEAVLATVREAKTELSRFARDPIGVAHLGVPPSVSECLTSDIFEGLKRQFPRMTLRITEGWTGHLRQLLLEGRLDLAVLSSSQVDRRLNAVPLLTERICLVSAAGKAVLPCPVPITKLAKLPLVLAPLPHGGRLTVERFFKRHGFKANVVLESEVWSVIKDIVQKGIASTLVPTRETWKELKAGTLTALPLEAVIHHSLVLASRNKTAPLPRMPEVSSYVASHLRKALVAPSDTFEIEASFRPPITTVASC